MRQGLIDRKKLTTGSVGRADFQAEGTASAQALRQDHSQDTWLSGEGCVRRGVASRRWERSAEVLTRHLVKQGEQCGVFSESRAQPLAGLSRGAT